MAEISYHFTPENGIGETEVIVTYRKSDKQWVALIPSKDEWLDGDLEDLHECLGAAIEQLNKLRVPKIDKEK